MKPEECAREIFGIVNGCQYSLQLEKEIADLIRQVITEEREACAKIVAAAAPGFCGSKTETVLYTIADSIRQRSKSMEETIRHAIAEEREHYIKTINDVVPKGTTLVVGVWKLDDCDYVAANSKEEAVEWYERTILDRPVGEIEESSLDDEVNIAEEGEPVQLISNRQLITDELAKGETLPMIVGTDPHYA